MKKIIWQVWLNENHMLGGFETKAEAKAWVKRYAPECKIKPFELDEEN